MADAPSHENPSPTTISAKDAAKLAARLAAQSAGKAEVAGKALTEAETDDTAAKVIRALLKHVNPSDVFTLEA